MKIKNKIKNILFMTIIAMTSLFFMNSSLAVTKGTVTVETAKLREEPNLDCKVLELISVDEEVDVIEKVGEWYQVQYEGITGYLRQDLLSVEGDVTQNNEENTEVNTTTSNTEENSTQTENGSNAENASSSTNEEQQTQENQNEQTQSEETAQTSAEAVEQNEELPQDMLGNKKIVSDTKLKIIPSINATDIVELKAEEEVTVTEVINGWACVEAQNTKGWIRQEKLKDIEETPQEQQEEATTDEETEETSTQPEQETKIKTQYINSQTVNLRREANTSSEILETLAINTPVDVYAEENGWSRVIVNDIEGYISTALLSDTRQETTRSMNPREVDEETSNVTETEEKDSTQTASDNTGNPAPGNGATVIETANQYLGYKYIYGGSSPETGFDCSGFTSYVFKQHGVTLSRTAAGQYNNGVEVSRENLLPGDLIMFGSSISSINHVGIYLGGGKIIHAPNSTRGVTTDTINSGYYNTNYVGARRVM